MSRMSREFGRTKLALAVEQSETAIRALVDREAREARSNQTEGPYTAVLTD